MLLNFTSRLFLRNTYLAMAGLHCVMPALLLWHTGPLVVAYRLQSTQTQRLWSIGLTVLWPVASWLPDQGSNPHPRHCKADSQPLDHWKSPYFKVLLPSVWCPWELYLFFPHYRF